MAKRRPSKQKKSEIIRIQQDTRAVKMGGKHPDRQRTEGNGRSDARRGIAPIRAGRSCPLLVGASHDFVFDCPKLKKSGTSFFCAAEIVFIGLSGFFYFSPAPSRGDFFQCLLEKVTLTIFRPWSNIFQPSTLSLHATSTSPPQLHLPPKKLGRPLSYDFFSIFPVSVDSPPRPVFCR